MTLVSTSSTTSPAFWALLVGINAYQSPDVNPLRGCVNDVMAMRQFLINQLGVPDTQIQVLIDEQATRQNILDMFQSFLINNPNIPRDSQLLFHYSGHGSQMPSRSPNEPDGLDETLVPHDSRVGNVFDIPDKTLAALITRLAAAKGSNITVILDACHSGSGTRALSRNGAALTRQIPADDRPPPPDLDADLRADTQTRGGRSGVALSTANHLLLAGCMDRQLSHEYQPREPIWHGVLTYFTLQYLRTLPPNATYDDLYAYVKAHVGTQYPLQTPQCEASPEYRRRAVFTGIDVQRDPFIPIKEVANDRVTLEAGLVHGVHGGTQLALYPSSVTMEAELPPPLARVTVQSVTATTATATVDAGTTSVIPVDARARITMQSYGGDRQSITLVPASDPQAQAALDRLQAALNPQSAPSEPNNADATSSPYLKWAPADDPDAQLQVSVHEDAFHITNERGELLVTPIAMAAANSVTKTRQALESIARFRRLRDLANREQSQLTGKIKLQLRRCTGGKSCTSAEQQPVGADDPDAPIILTYDPATPARNYYVIDIVNESALDVYPHLFIMNPDYSIYRLYPKFSSQEALPPGGTLTSGLADSGGYSLDVSLLDDHNSSSDCLKAIITTQASDLARLEQEPLSVPPPKEATRGVHNGTRSSGSDLEQLLSSVVGGSGTRGRPNKPEIGEDWGTAELPYTVVRRAHRIALPAGRGTVPLDHGLMLTKPESFEGTLTLDTFSATTRGGTPAVPPPPALAHFPDQFQLIEAPNTRSVGPSGLVLTLDANAEARRSITVDNPLRLELPVTRGDAVADLLPVIFDGEDYLLAGYSPDGGRTVEIVHLPDPVPTTRGFGTALKLFIYKKMGRYTPRLGLRSATLENGEVVYGAVDRQQFKPGDSVALFVHGFTSDSAWMVKTIAPFVREEVLPYTHLLTFDYETFGTGVADNGAQLALALQQQCGLSAHDQITLHVYAHSMGSLVSRCMIELSGGHDFVDRLVMAGPPNGGTTLANSARGLTYLLSSLLNRVTLIPPLGAVNWTIKQLYEQGKGWADLTTSSAVIGQINALSAPSNVPYLVLFGDNRVDEQQHTRLNRIARKLLDQTLDTLFGDQHDLVIGVNSMRGVRNGTYAKATPVLLACDHFGYYLDPEAQAAIKGWQPAQEEA